MKKVLFVAVAALGLSGLSGCALSNRAPLTGLIYTDATASEDVSSNVTGSKRGEACASSVLGLVATGDASIGAAARSGGITRISYVDGKSTSVLGLFANYCTIVHGD